jgi:hypothetical protein
MGLLALCRLGWLVGTSRLREWPLQHSVVVLGSMYIYVYAVLLIDVFLQCRACKMAGTLAAFLGLSIRRGDVGLAAASPIGLLPRFVSASLSLSPAPTLRHTRLSHTTNAIFAPQSGMNSDSTAALPRFTVSRSLDIDSRTSYMQHDNFVSTEVPA